MHAAVWPIPQAAACCRITVARASPDASCTGQPAQPSPARHAESPRRKCAQHRCLRLLRDGVPYFEMGFPFFRQKNRERSKGPIFSGNRPDLRTTPRHLSRTFVHHRPFIVPYSTFLGCGRWVSRRAQAHGGRNLHAQCVWLWSVGGAIRMRVLGGGGARLVLRFWACGGHCRTNF